MPRIKANNPYEEKLLANIQKHGWYCNYIKGKEGEPSFAYTIGLSASYGHPEVIIFGLSMESAYGLLSDVATLAAKRHSIDMSRPVDKLLKNLPCYFIEVPAQERDRYALSARWYYEGLNFPMFQLVWPSQSGLFPWDYDDQSFIKDQPILGDIPATEK